MERTDPVVPARLTGTQADLEQAREERAREEIRNVLVRRRTRQVLDAAARMMSETDFHSVSMQALAHEASVSVGLIYRYFSGKEDIVVAVVLDLVAEINAVVDERMTAAGHDPLDRLLAGFAAYCEVLDARRDAGLLTYRQSGQLSSAARDRIKQAEGTTGAPLRAAAEDAQRAGLLAAGVRTDVVVFDLMILAQSWPLKHWHFPAGYSLQHYIADQSAVILRSILAPTIRRRYQRHLAPPS